MERWQLSVMVAALAGTLLVACGEKDTPGPQSAACRSCVAARCSREMVGCEAFADGSQRRACLDVLACVRGSSCIAGGGGVGPGDSGDCYCGSVSPGACLAGGADGPCRAQIEHAAEPPATARPDDRAVIARAVADRYLNPAHPLGRAQNLMACELAACRPSCVPEQEDAR